MRVFSSVTRRLDYLFNIWTNATMKTLLVVVVAQLVERSLPTPEVRGSNLVIGTLLYYLYAINCIGNSKNEEKEAGNGPVYIDYLMHYCYRFDKI